MRAKTRARRKTGENKWEFPITRRAIWRAVGEPLPPSRYGAAVREDSAAELALLAEERRAEEAAARIVRRAVAKWNAAHPENDDGADCQDVGKNMLGCMKNDTSRQGGAS